MTARIHILLDEADKARYRRLAAREGKSLGAWLREAAEDRVRATAARRSLRSREDLEAFFAECDGRETKREPDWEEQESLIARSKTHGLDGL
jgi:hypothetical protein